MRVIHRLRSYHALLAILVVLAYVTGDDSSFHIWLGYAVGVVILIRLAWSLTGVPQLGLKRFYPHFDGLRLTTAMTHPAISRTLLLGIATCLIGVTFTGIVLDRGQAIGLGDQKIVGSVNVYNDDRERDIHDDDEDESLVGEVHEGVANLLMLFILTHVAYLLLFKRPLAVFMLFFHTPLKKDEST